MLVDSHCHLDFPDFEPERRAVIDRAVAAGVGLMVTISTRVRKFPSILAIAEENAEVFCSVGTHPHNAGEETDVTAPELVRLAGHPKVVAIGETGLDFYRDTAEPENQRRAFIGQADIAARLDLPLVIHARDPQGKDDAIAEIFATLEEFPDLTVVLHCFSAPDRVGEAAERGWYCSFAGNVTYPANEELRRAAALVPEDRILVETDAPYLTPQSRRRERNQPAFVVETAEKVAEVRGVGYRELEQTVTANAARLFGW